MAKPNLRPDHNGTQRILSTFGDFRSQVSRKRRFREPSALNQVSIKTTLHLEPLNLKWRNFNEKVQTSQDHVRHGRDGRGQVGMTDIESVFIYVTGYEAFMSFLISDIHGKMLRSC